MESKKMMCVYVVYCENCKTNERHNETAFEKEENAINYINHKSNMMYSDWYYDYEAIKIQDVPDINVGK